MNEDGGDGVETTVNEAFDSDFGLVKLFEFLESGILVIWLRLWSRIRIVGVCHLGFIRPENLLGWNGIEDENGALVCVFFFFPLINALVCVRCHKDGKRR